MTFEQLMRRPIGSPSDESQVQVQVQQVVQEIVDVRVTARWPCDLQIEWVDTQRLATIGFEQLELQLAATRGEDVDNQTNADLHVAELDSLRGMAVERPDRALVGAMTQ